MTANQEIARLLHELATLTELEDGSPQSFRVRAYERAARAVEGLQGDASTMTEVELTRVKGIGTSIAKKIGQYAKSGTIPKLEELRRRYPSGYVELIRLPGLGPRKLAILRESLGVETLDDLRAAIEGRQLREIRGLGAKTEENLARSIEELHRAGQQHRAPILQVLPLAEAVVAELRRLPQADRVEYAGSLRRFRETIGDLDIVVASHQPEPVMERFCKLAVAAKVIARGATKSSVVTHRGMQIDLRVVEPHQLGAAMVYFTGSKAHNIALRQRALGQGWTLNEYGLSELETEEVIASETEADIYQALGMQFVPPPLREDSGEVEAAARHDLPDLVSLADIKGDLHDHTSLSGDGRDSLEEMVAAAAQRGLRYLAITDHGEDLSINGVSPEEMRKQSRRIEELQEAYPDLVILHGAELNIGLEGDLDYDDEFLMGFDWCVASVHSYFRLDPDRQTERVVRAMRHPAVNAIGHLTGRRIGKRTGIELHLDRLLEAAAQTGTALEVNSNLDRLDAPADVLRRAGEGVVFVISTDAHDVAELDNLRFGVLNAQRGWVERRAVANTWEPDRFLDWARAKRR